MGLYYDRIADIYDATRALPPQVDEQVTECILRLVGATPETRFLEPGIGTGLNALPIVQRGYFYTGIDISKEMMEQLRRKLGGVPNNLKLIQADASSLMFEDDSFDVVLMRHMLHLIPDWRSCLSEIRRVIKPSGVYLYCESVWTQHQKEFEQQWQAILEPYKPPQNSQSSAGDSAGKQEIIQVLMEQGATIETVTAARWRVEQTVGELLNIYQTRDHGSCWSVPDDVFPSAMQDFRKWCQHYYGSEDVVLGSDATFDITVARDWATA